ncbi:hypothetical protein BIW11_06363, partial [Tropilaelaps mercedesae]
MALVSRLGGRWGLFGQRPLRQLSTSGSASQSNPGRAQKGAYAVLGLVGAGTAGVLVALESSPVHAADLIVHPSKYEWPH